MYEGITTKRELIDKSYFIVAMVALSYLQKKSF